MYVYVKSESNLWTVGFYDPSGSWISESDHSTREEAAARVSCLNGKEKSKSDFREPCEPLTGIFKLDAY